MILIGAPKLTAAALAVLAAPAFAAPLWASAQQQLLELAVMSFNIRYGTAPDGPDSWQFRRDAMVELLRRELPDVIGLQEALYLQLGEIRSRLPVYGGIGSGRDDGALAGEFSAILYRTDRFNIVNSGTFWFSDTPELPGSASWGNRVTRICTWAHLREKATGRRFWIYNVHLDHESQASRERSVALLLERIAARGGDDPVIVTGDFNAGEDNPAVRAMLAEFRDSYRLVHSTGGVAGTFNAFRGDSTGPKIDYVLVPPHAAVLGAAILRDRREDGRYPSDHFPVTARIRLPPREAAVAAAPGGEVAGIVVTATRSERGVEEQVIRVEVVGPEEIEEKLAMTPGDVTMLLNETGGLRVVSTAPSLGGANVRVHGLRGRYTQVLADGLPLHGQTGSLGLLQIPPMDLQQVEVVKGAASAMWGAGSLGGLVNFVSRRPTGSREVLLNATSRGGADAVFFGSGFLSPEAGWTLLTGVHSQARADVDRDGWADLPGYRRAVVRPRLFLDDGAGRTLVATAGATVEDRDGGTMEGRAAPDGGPFAEGLDTRRFDAGAGARTPLGPALALGARASAMTQAHRHVIGDTIDGDRHATLFTELSLQRPGARLSWLLGAAFQLERFRSDSVPRFDYTHRVPGLFAQLEVTPAPPLTVSLSVRYDEHNRYGSFVSPRFSALGRLGRGWTARASAGSGFFAPTPFIEETEAISLRRLGGLGQLKAERARSASFDVRGTIGDLEVGATLFRNVVDDPVVLALEPSAGPPAYELLNASQPVRSHGVDFVARWRRGPVHVIGSYTDLRATEAAAPDSDRRETLLNPGRTAGVVVMLDQERTSLGLEAYYTGPQPLGLENPYRQESPGYFVYGLLVQRRIGSARLFLNLENLGDARVTRTHSLLRASRDELGRWTVDAWGPLEGRVINGGVRVRM